MLLGRGEAEIAHQEHRRPWDCSPGDRIAGDEQIVEAEDTYERTEEAPKSCSISDRR